MKIGFKFDSSFCDIDFTHITDGNPGVGGTQYEFVLLAHYLLLDTKFNVCFFVSEKNKFEPSIEIIYYKNQLDIPCLARNNGVDILVFGPAHDQSWYQVIKENKINSVVWAHNFLGYPELKRIHENEYIKAVVAVSKEQYELMSSEVGFEKCTYIYNMFDSHPNKEINISLQHNICYMGALTPVKGLHVLAREWKNILKSVADANLYIIGSELTYYGDKTRGDGYLPCGTYGKTLIKILSDNGPLMDSVHFLGNLGAEKREVFDLCRVGVVNPTALSETFCISAVEMQAAGLPVCSRRKNGLKNTICNKVSGLLSLTNVGLRNNIIRLLTDDELCIRLSKNAVEYSKMFSGSNIASEWISLFENIYNHKERCTKKVLNRPLYALGKVKRNVCPWIPTPLECRYFLGRVMKILVKFVSKPRSIKIKIV